MKSNLRLVKNSEKVVLPPKKINPAVKAAIIRAMVRAVDQNWTKVVIIGEGKESGGWESTRLRDITILGMLDIARHYILHD